MRELTRRLFIQRLLQSSMLASLPALVTNEALAQTNYNGKLLVTVQFQGAWDVTSFCDPKANVAGEKEINTWARSKSIGTAGRLRYAPYGINQKFFNKYYDRMLVINGVDMQTNAHETGETITWSGRTALGFPSLTALHAALNAPGKALAYLRLGGWGNTEGIINATRISNVADLRSVIYPNVNIVSPIPSTVVSEAGLGRIGALHMRMMERRRADHSALPQDQINRYNYEQALLQSGGLKVFGDLIPAADKIQAPREAGANKLSTVHQQAQIALLAFKSGLCVAADLLDSAYDTHEYHDRDHEPLLANTLDAIDYLWDYAEQLGLADRLMVVMGSDFGRTPYYNANQGKDHWPIGSYVVMEKNRSYTNRMLGETDGGHNAMKINPSTLARDDSKGTLIYSRHVHKALRRYLGIEGTALDKLFPFADTEDFKFFS